MDKIKSFAALVRAHVKTHWLSYALIWLVASLFGANYRIGVNETASLPQKLFIVHLNEQPKKGDYVAFRVPPAAAKNFSNPNAILSKILIGTEGDTVTVKDRVVMVNGAAVGYAKERSRKGEVLEPLAETTIPPGQMYVMGLHKDSLDSRYTIVGLVPRESVVGRAYPIF